MADDTDTPPPAATAAADSVDTDEELPLITLFEPNEECVCEFGDVILCADDGFHPPQKLRVSSCILAMSSKPFKALFSKKFAEGQAGADRDSGKPHEIVMKDKPTPLRQLCQLLHHVDSMIYSELELFEVALLADKYDVVAAIRIQAEAFLARYIGIDQQYLDPEEGLDMLVAASMIFELHFHFQKFTTEFVMRSYKVDDRFIHWRCVDIFPPNLLSSMRDQQNNARQELTSSIMMLVQRFTETCEIEQQQGLVHKLIQRLTSERLMPPNFKHFNLGELLDRLKDVDIPVVPAKEKIEEKKRRCSGDTIYDFDPLWGPLFPRRHGISSDLCDFEDEAGRPLRRHIGTSNAASRKWKPCAVASVWTASEAKTALSIMDAERAQIVGLMMTTHQMWTEVNGMSREAFQRWHGEKSNWQVGEIDQRSRKNSFLLQDNA